MDEKLLQINNLTVEYIVDNVVVKAVADLSFEIKQGECVGLVGETGAGKSTLIETLRILLEESSKLSSQKTFCDLLEKQIQLDK